jgi:hypothetical protein
MFSPGGAAVRIVSSKKADEKEVKKGEIAGKRVPQKAKTARGKSRKGEQG